MRVETGQKGTDAVRADGVVPVVLVGLRACRCAIPLEHVIETLRPLPIAEVAGAPPLVAGQAINRGAPVPVVDLDRLLGGGGATAGRFVTVRAGGRRLALRVGTAFGIFDAPAGDRTQGALQFWEVTKPRRLSGEEAKRNDEDAEPRQGKHSGRANAD